jgi:hypothetical protein
VVEDPDSNLVFCGVATTVTVKLNVLKIFSHGRISYLFYLSLKPS